MAMRKLLVVCAGFLAGAAGPVWAQEEPRALIERAIQAHGGMERLSRVRADKVKLKGTLEVSGRTVPFVAETTVQLPAQFKTVIQLTVGNDKHTVVQVLNGDKAFITLN